MSREIKFRAWDKGHRKMSYKVNLYSLNNTGKIDRAQIDNKQIMNIIGFDCEIMQYTGLKDKNGKEIYEGDIVNCNRYESNEDHIVKIEDIRILPQQLYGSNLNWLEVLGNIYENSDLIK